MLLQGAAELSCLQLAPLTQCAANGTLSHSRFLTDVYIAPSPTALPSLKPTVSRAVSDAGTAVTLSAGGAPPATAARGGGCDNVMRRAAYTVLMSAQGKVEAVYANVTLGSVVADASGVVAAAATFAVSFRTVGTAVRTCFFLSSGVFIVCGKFLFSFSYLLFLSCIAEADCPAGHDPECC